VNPDEKQALRALIGSLQYAAVNTRPDLSSRLSHLQSTINSATIQNLIDANRVLHEAKRHKDTTITIQSIPISKLRFLAFSDTSFSSKHGHDDHDNAREDCRQCTETWYLEQPCLTAKSFVRSYWHGQSRTSYRKELTSDGSTVVPSWQTLLRK